MINSKFIISDDVFDKCDEFAIKSVGTSTDKYSRRNQNDSSKIIKDIRCGKIAEEYLYQKLVLLYPKLNPPDYNIYSSKDKSWSADLEDPVTKVKFACKSQDADARYSYDESYVFQYNYGKSYDCDKAIFKEEDDKHYVCFVALNTPRKFGELRAIVKVSWLHQNKMFDDMKKESLKGNKVAVYYDKLAQFKDDLWQI